MTSAREQAREAAKAVDWGYNHRDCADAASDVWEPLLRDLVDEVEWLLGMMDDPPLAVMDKYHRAKEALGE